MILLRWVGPSGGMLPHNRKWVKTKKLVFVSVMSPHVCGGGDGVDPGLQSAGKRCASRTAGVKAQSEKLHLAGTLHFCRKDMKKICQKKNRS